MRPQRSDKVSNIPDQIGDMETRSPLWRPLQDHPPATYPGTRRTNSGGKMGIIHQNGHRVSFFLEERKEIPQRGSGVGGYPEDKLWRKEKIDSRRSPSG